MDYLLLDPLKEPELLRACIALGKTRLGKCPRSKVFKTLRLHTRRLLVAAREGDAVVGFKLGFSERPGIFYSWLGAVAETHESRGIGRRLMELQHQHLAENGYHLIRTATRNQFRRMLIMNLQSGFDLVGTSAKPDGLLLLLEKRLP